MGLKTECSADHKAKSMERKMKRFEDIPLRLPVSSGGTMKFRKAMSTYAVILAFTLIPMLLPATSHAATGDMTIGGKLGLATSPAPGLGAGIGIIFGSFAYQFLDRIPARGDDGLEGVGEIGYFSWSGNGGTVSNLPLFFMARYFYTVAPDLRAFGQAGFSLNFWTAPGASEADLGFATGVGVEYLFTPEMGVGGEMRLNVVRPSWWDADHVLFMASFNYHILAPHPEVVRIRYHREYRREYHREYRREYRRDD